MKRTLTAFLVIGLMFEVPAFGAGPGDYSGIIIAAGVSQTVVAASANRTWIFCQNPSATASGVTAESLFINWGAAASGTISANTGSVELANLGTLNFNASNTPISVIRQQFTIVGATINHRFICKQG